ncbi:MAG: 50S ribosomal protein L29 [Gammaproteobacteria bacterium]|nr:MAG: 50S ribosomal protein L29 [Gammaproteobacteria bacterium]RTZ68433.1 MAG: 50S ribosomal protein L29 [Aquificaceae bacterium]
MKIEKLDPKELRKLSIKDLEMKLKDLKLVLMKLRMKQQIDGTLENPMAIRITKRNIARILTIIREKQLKGEN